MDSYEEILEVNIKEEPDDENKTVCSIKQEDGLNLNRISTINYNECKDFKQKYLIVEVPAVGDTKFKEEYDVEPKDEFIKLKNESEGVDIDPDDVNIQIADLNEEENKDDNDVKDQLSVEKIQGVNQDRQKKHRARRRLDHETFEERKKRLNRERQQRLRARRRITDKTPEQTAEQRRANAERQARVRASQTEQQKQQRRDIERNRHKQRQDKQISQRPLSLDTRETSL